MRSPDDKSANDSGQVQQSQESDLGGTSEGGTRGPAGGSPATSTEVQIDGFACPVELAPLLDNMGASKLKRSRNQAEESSDVTQSKCCASLDLLVLSFSVCWHNKFFDEVLPVLSRHQAEARSGSVQSVLKIGAESFVVKPHGGRGGAGVFRHFAIEGCGITWEISQCSAEDPAYFNCVVTVGSVTCQTATIADIRKTVWAFFDIMGGKVLDSVVSRLDIRVDTNLITPHWVAMGYFQNKAISRARKGSLYFTGYRINGFRLGCGTLIRIYDKLAEVLQSGDAEKLDLIKQEAGGVPEKWTRVEDQIRKDTLREINCGETKGIRSLDDVEKHLAGIGRYMSEKWFRICEEVDRNNSQLAEVSPEWKQISEAFATLDGEKTLVKREIKKSEGRDGLVSQAFGCILKRFARQTGSPTEMKRLFMEAWDTEFKRIGPDKFKSKVVQISRESRFAAFGASTPFYVVSVFDEFKHKQEREWLAGAIERKEAFRRENPDLVAEARAKLTENWCDSDASFDPSMWEDGESCIEGKEVEPSDYVPF